MARVKQLRVVFTFPTTTEAMKMERTAREKGGAGRLIPVPVKISAGCGMAWSAPAKEREALEALIRENGIESEGTYELLL